LENENALSPLQRHVMASVASEYVDDVADVALCAIGSNPQEGLYRECLFHLGGVGAIDVDGSFIRIGCTRRVRNDRITAALGASCRGALFWKRAAKSRVGIEARRPHSLDWGRGYSLAEVLPSMRISAPPAVATGNVAPASHRDAVR